MNIQIKDSCKFEVFKDIFKHLNVFGEVFNLHFSKNRFYIQGMDSAHVSLFELVLVPSWFDSYVVDHPIVVGLDISILFKIFNMKRDDHIVYLHIPEGGDKFEIRLEGKINQRFHIPVLDIETELLQIPEDTEWTADITIYSKLFSDLMNKQSLFGESIYIKCSEKMVEMTSEDQMLGEMRSRIEFDDILGYGIEEDAEVEVSYSLKYMLYMTCFADISRIMTVNVSKKIPLRIHYSLDKESDDPEEEELSEPENFMNFYLAPKLEDY